MQTMMMTTTTTMMMMMIEVNILLNIMAKLVTTLTPKSVDKNQWCDNFNESSSIKRFLF